MISEKIWSGVNNLIDSYAKVTKEDVVLIVFTKDCKEPAAWIIAALKQRKVNCSFVGMTPLIDSTFEDRLVAALPKIDKVTGRLVILTLEKDTISHDSILKKATCQFSSEKLLIIRSISVCDSFFEEAMHADPLSLSGKNTTLLNRMIKANRLRITTKGGTDLKIKINSDLHRWISNRGVYKPGSSMILPAGEVATFPADVEGVFVADFAYNVNAITSLDSRLNKQPVTLQIKDGRVTEYHCENEVNQKFLGQCFSKFCAYNVGELGFGTNSKCDFPIFMNSHLNERTPGVHLGFGQHNQDPQVVGYKCDIHLDLIAKGGLVWIDDDPTPLDLENLEVSGEDHPTSARAEDVFSPGYQDLEPEDCCGILTSDGLTILDAK